MKDQNNLPDAGRGEAVPTELSLVQASRSLSASTRAFDRELDADAMLLELHNAFTADGDCETLLFMQSRILDSIFNRLIVRAFAPVSANGEDGGENAVNDAALNLALRSQKQCRTTIETLSAVKRRASQNFADKLKDHEKSW